jgi:hypothetical protein
MTELPPGFSVDPAELPEGFQVDAPKRKVGPFETALRVAAQAAGPAVRTFDMAAAGLAGMFGDTAGQEKIFKESEQRQARMREEYAQKADEEFSGVGEVAGGVLSSPQALLNISAVPGLNPAAINRASEVVERGGTLPQAAKAGAVTGAVEQALAMLPTHLGGKVAEKIGGGAVRQAVGGAVTGAAVNVPAGAVGRAAENAALPEGEQYQDLQQSPTDTKNMLVEAGMSAALGAVGARGAHARAKAVAAKAPPAFPKDKLEDLGNGDFRAPNGATITEDAWKSASPKVREGWLEEAPKEPKETPEPKLPEEIERLKQEHPSGPVADALREVEAKRQKAAKVKADAEELRRAADQTTDPEIKKILNARADKLDPREKIPVGQAIEGEPTPEKIPVGEVKEGQPEIKTEQPKKLPVGEATEVPEPYSGEKIPTGEAREVAASGVEPVERVPTGEAKELYVPPEKRNATQEVVKQEGVQPERVKGNEGGQAAEAGAGDRVQRAAEGGGPEALSEHKDLTFPQIDETLLNQARREPVAAPPPPKREVERGAAAVRKIVDDAVASGKLDKDTADMVHWILDQNPRAARNLGLKVEGAHEQGALGAYNPVQRIVRLFKSSSGENALHEILHHVERMLPHDVQLGIQKEWRRNLARAMEKATPEQRHALQDAQTMITGETQAVRDLAQKRMVQSFKDGVLNPREHYHLVDPSEFWAVHGARILRERFTGRGSWRAKAARWLKDFAEKAKGTLGLRSDAPVLRAIEEMMATRGRSKAGRQIVTSEKLAVREREQLAVGPPTKMKPARRELPEETRADVAERKLFDRFNRTLTLFKVEAPKSEAADFYRADQLYQGRAQHRGDVMERDFIKPLGKALDAAKKAGLTVKDADDYLMAQHAPERNREIAKINPKAPDGGSGLTNKQAADIIAGFTPEQRTHLDAVAKIVRDLNAKKLDDLVADGLIKPEVRDVLNRKYKNYVPLKTLEQEDDFLGIGQGYSMRASDIQEALGRQSKAGSPIAASVMDASRSIIRGEKARVDRSIWEYSKQEGAKDFIQQYDPDKPPPEVMGRKKGPDGQVKAVVDAKKVRDLTVDLVVNGEEKKVFVPDRLLRDQIKKLATTADPGVVLSTIAKGTSAVGRMLTEFNPAFTLPNAVRDAITIGIRAKAHGVSPATVITSIPKAWGEILSYKRNPNGENAKLYKEFLETGGKTGAYGIQDVADTMSRLESAGAALGYDEHTGGVPRKAKAVLKDVAKVISSGNEIMEYAGRFAVYKELRAKGESPAAAALAAKEITVNFNRSGEYGRVMNSLFVFANASLQGLRNTIVYAKNPAVVRGMLGLMVLGGMAQAYNESVGGTDEETNEPNINTQSDTMADKNLMLLKPGSASGVKIPLPPEYSWLFALGRRAWRGFSQGDIKREAAGIAGNLIDATLPVRLPEADAQTLSLFKAAMPTLITPYGEVFLNQNYFGQPIVPDTHGDKSPPPYFKQARSTTSDVTKGISEILNTATGGDPVTPGWSQKALGPLVSPEGIEHIVGSYTGGLGQLALQSKNLVDNARKGKPVEVNKLPIANRFVFEEPKSYTSRRYKELTPQFEYARDYQKAGQPEKIDPKIARSLGEFEGAERELRVLFKRLRSATTDAEKDSLQNDIKRTQARVVRAYNGQPVQ